MVNILISNFGNAEMAITDELRKAIAASNKNLSVIAEESGIPQPMLHRFVAGKDLRLATAEKLAVYFGLKLCPDTAKPAKQKRRK
jgi:hypothetical protein